MKEKVKVKKVFRIPYASRQISSVDIYERRPCEPELLAKILPGVMADIRRRRKLRTFLAACKFHGS